MLTVLLLILSNLGSLAQAATVISVPVEAPEGTAPSLLPAFSSFSIELAWLPDYAGNSSSPNTFSNNLLEEIKAISGDVTPIIRVGGSSQDIAVYNVTLKMARVTTGSGLLPSTLQIGPSFFESLTALAGVKFIYGLNLKQSVLSSSAFQNMLDTVAAACTSFSSDNFIAWEYGNEPNLYSSGWDPIEYTDAWLNGTRAIKGILKEKCPDLAEAANFGFLTPSVSDLGSSHVNIPAILADGLNNDSSIFFLGTHNYMGSGKDSSVTLQNTLMNHVFIADSIASHVSLMNKTKSYGLPYTISETNSLFGEGKAGVSNTFGAALWTLDYTLYSAASGITRLNFHMGTDYRYSAWQPIQTASTTKGTKAPFYGNLAAAAMLGDLTNAKVQVSNLAIASDGTEVAYAIYQAGKLSKIAAISLKEYNFTASGVATDSNLNTASRTNTTFTFNVDPSYNQRTATIRRLLAPGADSITGITWDGYTFNYEVNNGKATRLTNITYGEEVSVSGGKISIELPESSAALLEF